MNNCHNEKKCHDNCTRCEEYLELEERLKIACRNIVSYQHDRQDMLEANWNLTGENQELKRKIEKANEQIKCEIDELYTLKNIYVEIKNDYEYTNYRVRNLIKLFVSKFKTFCKCMVEWYLLIKFLKER